MPNALRAGRKTVAQHVPYLQPILAPVTSTILQIQPRSRCQLFGLFLALSICRCQFICTSPERSLRISVSDFLEVTRVSCLVLVLEKLSILQHYPFGQTGCHHVQPTSLSYNCCTTPQYRSRHSTTPTAQGQASGNDTDCRTVPI